MIFIDDILELHDRSLKQTGGGTGVRDIGVLESAIARPFQTFGGEDLYPTPIEKAAALGESLIVNHPFVDGNKRTGFLAMATLLREYGVALSATNDAAYGIVVAIASGEKRYKELLAWLDANTQLL